MKSICQYCQKEKEPARGSCWRTECKKTYMEAYMKAYRQRPEQKAYRQKNKLSKLK